MNVRVARILLALGYVLTTFSSVYLLAPAANAHDFGGTTQGEDSDPPPAPKCCKKCGCEGGGFGGAGGGGGGGGGGSGPGGSGGGDGPPPGFTGGVGGDPIWFYDGRIFLGYTDLSVGTLFPIALTREYRNVSEFDSALGYGWAFLHDRRLFEYPDGSVTMRIGSGRTVRFVHTGGAFVTPNDGLQGELTQLGNGSYVFRRADAQVDYYDADGRLTAIQNRTGHRHDFTYDARGPLPLVGTSKRSVDPGQPMVVAYQPRLTRIEERSADGASTGAAVNFNYDEATGRLTHIVADDGRRLDYSHDEVHGNLVEVSGLDTYHHTYAYSDVNDPHNLTSLVLGMGATPVVNTYDTQDRVTRQVLGEEVIDLAYPTPTTRTVTWTIKNAGGATLHTRVHSFVYSGSDLVKETNALGHELRQVFNAQRDLVRREIWQKPTSGALFLLKATDWTYDAQGRVLTESVTLDSGEVATSTTTYDHGWVASEQTTSTADPQLFRTEFTFVRDAQGQPTNIHQVKRRNDDGTFATTSYAYCTAADVANPAAECPQLGLLKSIDGPRVDVADVTTFSYYSATNTAGCGTETGPCHRIGDLKRTANALGHASTVDVYDADGRVVRTTDANGQVVKTTYHARGWPLMRTLVGTAPGSFDDATTTWTYDARGNVTSATDADGVVTLFVHDGRDRLTETQDAEGNRLLYTIGSDGQKLAEEVRDAAGVLKRRRTYVYDKLARLITENDAHDRPTQYEYDAGNRQTAVVDALGRRMEQQYDDLDRLTKTIHDAATGGLRVTTQFAYDAAGQLRQVTDPKGLITDYAYDALGRLTQLDSPDTGTTTYSYDLAGNRIEQLDARNLRSEFEYDASNRMTNARYGTADTQEISYEYDLAASATSCPASATIGRLSRMTDPSGSTQYCYDSRGNVTRKSQNVGGAQEITYGYTLGGRLAALGYPGGVQALYTYDTAGRIASMTLDGTPLVTTATWLPFGPLSGITFAGGAQQAFAYDQNYAIEAITGTALNHDYVTDALGNVTGLVHTDPTQARTYEYDTLSRLTKVKDGSATMLEGFSYDATGNRLSKQTGATPTQSYGYPSSSHRLTSIDAATRSYDAIGSLTNDGAGMTYSYDTRQRLSRVERNAQVLYLAGYNGRGERVTKTRNPGLGAIVDKFIYDERGRLLTESRKNGSSPSVLTRHYVWLQDRPVALKQVADAYGGETLHVHSDHLATPRAVTRLNASNAVVWHWPLTGAAFGEHEAESDPDQDRTELTLNLRFPGQYLDGESRLHYNYFRNLEPSVARYIESDPIGLRGGASTFAYVAQRPLMLRDRFGLAAAYLDFSPDEERRMRAANEEAIKVMKACSKCTDCGKNGERQGWCIDDWQKQYIINYLMTAEYNKQQQPHPAGWAAEWKVGNEVLVYPDAFNSVCALASTLAHEAGHATRLTHQQMFTYELECFGCSRFGPVNVH